MFVPLYGSGWCTSGPTPTPTVTYRVQLAQKWDNTPAKMPKKRDSGTLVLIFATQVPLPTCLCRRCHCVNTHADANELGRMQTYTLCVNAVGPPGHRQATPLLLLNKRHAPRLMHTKWLQMTAIALHLSLVVLSIFSRLSWSFYISLWSFVSIFSHFLIRDGIFYVYF